MAQNFNNNGYPQNGNQNQQLNVCINHTLRCLSIRQNQNGTITLNCAYSTRPLKNKDGSFVLDNNGNKVYPPPHYIQVYCDSQKCRMQQANYERQAIKVSGTKDETGYWSTQKNCYVLQETIYATSVELSFPNGNNQNGNGNYSQNGGNFNNGGYRNNGGGFNNRQNGNYPQNNFQNNGYPQNGYQQNNGNFGGQPNGNFNNQGNPQFQPNGGNFNNQGNFQNNNGQGNFGGQPNNGNFNANQGNPQGNFQSGNGNFQNNSNGNNGNGNNGNQQEQANNNGQGIEEFEEIINDSNVPF